MKKADEYRFRAAECLALALTMPGTSEKEQLRRMASIWESLAAAEQSSDAEDGEGIPPNISFEFGDDPRWVIDHVQVIPF